MNIAIFPAVNNRTIILKQCLTYESIVNPAADEHRYFPAVNNKKISFETVSDIRVHFKLS